MWSRSLVRPFNIKPKLSISLDRQSEILESFLIVCPSPGLPKYIKTKVLTITLTLYKAFLKKTKRGLELVSLVHFLDDF